MRQLLGTSGCWRMFAEQGSLPERLPGPGTRMLERGLLLLALGLGLASTQGTLEEVPVQPGFDAQKVGIVGPALRRYQDRDWTASHRGGAQARGRGWGSAQPVLQELWWTQEHEPQGLPVFSQETEAKRGPHSLLG